MINWLRTRRYWPWWLYDAFCIGAMVIFWFTEKGSWEEWAMGVAAVGFFILGLLSWMFPPYHGKELDDSDEEELP